MCMYIYIMYNTEIHVRVHVALHIGLCRCLKYIKSDHGIISQHFSFVQTHPSVVALGKKQLADHQV